MKTVFPCSGDFSPIRTIWHQLDGELFSGQTDIEVLMSAFDAADTTVLQHLHQSFVFVCNDAVMDSLRATTDLKLLPTLKQDKWVVLVSGSLRVWQFELATCMTTLEHHFQQVYEFFVKRGYSSYFEWNRT